MAEYIDRSELLRIESLLDSDVLRASKTASVIYDQIMYDIEHIPAADVAEVKHGKWIKCSVIKCSVCGSCTDIQSDEAYEKFIESYYYCPVCGSKLDLED